MGIRFDRPPFQLGIVVRDLDKTVDGWLTLGAGPFFCAKALALGPWTYEGQEINFELDVAVSYLNDLQIEIMSPVGSAKSPYRDFVDGGGDGLHHLAFMVDDLDEEASKTHGRLLARGSFGGVDFAYLEQEPDHGPLAELVVASPILDGMCEAFKRHAVGWDGSEPRRDIATAFGQ